MKVSVITACYNAAETIEETIQSVLEQTDVDLEYLIIDGGSHDGTMEIVSRYRKQIAQLVSEKDGGMYFGLNKGIGLATGEVIAILNADDLYAGPTVLKQVVETFQKERSDTVYGNIKYVDRVNTSKVIRAWDSGVYERKKWLRGWMPPHPAFFARKDCYTRWGLFDATFKSAADYELMLRFLYKNLASSCHLNADCVMMRMGGKSNRSIKNRLLANREDIRAWQVNGLKPPTGLAILKPMRKIGQFFHKG